MSKSKSPDKKSFYSSVDRKAYDGFKSACAKAGITMQVALESFMKQFADGEFRMKIAEDFQMILRLRQLRLEDFQNKDNNKDNKK